MDFTETFLRLTAHLPNYREIYRIADDLSGGSQIWLIGGAVFRPLASAIWGGPFLVPDFDLLFERLAKDAVMPAGWNVEYNRYGNPKLLRDALEIDVIPMAGLSNVRRNNGEMKIEHYLAGTPLTIQSIAFDIRAQNLIGDVGKKALLERTVGANHRDELEHTARRYAQPPEAYADSRAVSLGFKNTV